MLLRLIDNVNSLFFKRRKVCTYVPIIYFPAIILLSGHFSIAELGLAAYSFYIALWAVFMLEVSCVRSQDSIHHV